MSGSRWVDEARGDLGRDCCAGGVCGLRRRRTGRVSAPGWTPPANFNLPTGATPSDTYVAYQAGGAATVAYLQIVSLSPVQTALHVGVIPPGGSYRQQFEVDSTSTSLPAALRSPKRPTVPRYWSGRPCRASAQQQLSATSRATGRPVAARGRRPQRSRPTQPRCRASTRRSPRRSRPTARRLQASTTSTRRSPAAVIGSTLRSTRPAGPGARVRRSHQRQIRARASRSGSTRTATSPPRSAWRCPTPATRLFNPTPSLQRHLELDRRHHRL